MVWFLSTIPIMSEAFKFLEHYHEGSWVAAPLRAHSTVRYDIEMSNFWSTVSRRKSSAHDCYSRFKPSSYVKRGDQGFNVC